MSNTSAPQSAALTTCRDAVMKFTSLSKSIREGTTTNADALVEWNAFRESLPEEEHSNETSQVLQQLAQSLSEEVFACSTNNKVPSPPKPMSQGPARFSSSAQLLLRSPNLAQRSRFIRQEWSGGSNEALALGELARRHSGISQSGFPVSAQVTPLHGPSVVDHHPLPLPAFGSGRIGTLSTPKMPCLTLTVVNDEGDLSVCEASTQGGTGSALPSPVMSYPRLGDRLAASLLSLDDAISGPGDMQDSLLSVQVGDLTGGGHHHAGGGWSPHYLGTADMGGLGGGPVELRLDGGLSLSERAGLREAQAQLRARSNFRVDRSTNLP